MLSAPLQRATHSERYASHRVLSERHPGDNVPLRVTYNGRDEVVGDDVTALIGSDAASTIRIVRPGISRRHAVVSYDGTGWKIEDAGSRNGTFKDGQRVQVVTIDGTTTVFLGHPTDGESLALTPIAEPASSSSQDGVDADIQSEVDAFMLPTPPPAPAPSPSRSRRVPTSAPTTSRVSNSPSATSAELAALTAALRDQIRSVKGLTWSVWAMIAVTAALAVMTLFVGIIAK